MKNLKTKLVITVLSLTFFCTACSVDKLIEKLDNCDTDALFKDALVEKTFYQNAIDAYATDPNTDNCNELKASGNDYVKSVQKYIDCGGDGNGSAKVKQELKDAKKALADLNCN